MISKVKAVNADYIPSKERRNQQIHEKINQFWKVFDKLKWNEKKNISSDVLFPYKLEFYLIMKNPP